MGEGLTGNQLIKHVRQNGYQGHMLMVSGIIPEGVSYMTLSKPITLIELRRTIEELLQ